MIDKVKSGRHWFEEISKYVDKNKKIDVYRNLNSDCWSVRQGRGWCVILTTLP